jgi:hypothetical protein
MSQLIEECEGRMPRDATVIAIVPKVTLDTVLTLASLKKRGFAVTAILNLYEDIDFADASIPLIAAGIQTLHLQDEPAIATICRQFALR